MVEIAPETGRSFIFSRSYQKKVRSLPGREPENGWICAKYKIPSVFIYEEQNICFNQSHRRI